MAHSTYLSTYRLDNYSPRLHMSVYQPATLWQGELTATPSNPTTSLAVAYDVNPDFTYGMQLPGFSGAQIVFRDPVSGRRKGTGRVRAIASSYPQNTTTVLKVRETGNGIAPLVSGDLFEIKAFYPLDTKLVEKTALFNPDGRYNIIEAYDPTPIANSGGHWAGWVGSSGIATVSCPGSLSFNTDPDWIGGVVGHDWEATSGTVTRLLGESDADQLFSITPGYGSVNHQVWTVAVARYSGAESNSNVYFCAHDADHPPYEVLLKDYSGDMDEGVSWSVEVQSDAVTEEDIPELAFCILWVDDTFAPTGLVSLNRTTSPDRSHIIGMGYARRVTSAFSADDGFERVTFAIQSPLARLAEIASYSNLMRDGAAGLDWTNMKTLGFQRGILQLWSYYTTGMEAGIDFLVDATFSDARYPAFNLQRSDPIGQMRELAKGRAGRIVNTEHGNRMELQGHPALVALGSRP